MMNPLVDLILEGYARTLSTDYPNWQVDPNPTILKLGEWRHPTTKNLLLGGINLNYLTDTEIEQLRYYLPEILRHNTLKQRYWAGRRLVPNAFDDYYRTYRTDLISTGKLGTLSFMTPNELIKTGSPELAAKLQTRRDTLKALKAAGSSETIPPDEIEKPEEVEAPEPEVPEVLEPEAPTEVPELEVPEVEEPPGAPPMPILKTPVPEPKVAPEAPSEVPEVPPEASPADTINPDEFGPPAPPAAPVTPQTPPPQVPPVPAAQAQGPGQDPETIVPTGGRESIPGEPESPPGAPIPQDAGEMSDQQQQSSDSAAQQNIEAIKKFKLGDRINKRLLPPEQEGL